jgi:hypothetical protein
MNLFNGFTREETISAILAFVVFNGFVVLLAFSLAAFYVASKPRLGVVRSAPIWHFVASLFFMMAVITTVWAAPAEKSFLNDAGDAFDLSLSTANRFAKLVIGAVFALIGITCMVIGMVRGGRQKRALAERAIFEDDHAEPQTA